MANGPIISVSPLVTANNQKKKKTTTTPQLGDPGFIQSQLRTVVGQQLAGQLPGTAQQAGQLARLAETQRRIGGAAIAGIPGIARSGVALAQTRAIEGDIAQQRGDLLAQQARDRAEVQRFGVTGALTLEQQEEARRAALVREGFEERRLTNVEEQNAFNQNFLITKQDNFLRQQAITNLQGLLASGTLNPEEELQHKIQLKALTTGEITPGYIDQQGNFIPNPEFAGLDLGSPEGQTAAQILTDLYSDPALGIAAGSVRDTTPLVDDAGNRILIADALNQGLVTFSQLGVNDWVELSLSQALGIDQFIQAQEDRGGPPIEKTGPTGTDEEGQPVFEEGNTRTNPETGEDEIFRNGEFVPDVKPDELPKFITIGDRRVQVAPITPEDSGLTGGTPENRQAAKGDTQTFDGQQNIWTGSEFVPAVQNTAINGGQDVVDLTTGQAVLVPMGININKITFDPQARTERLWTETGFRDLTNEEKIADILDLDTGIFNAADLDTEGQATFWDQIKGDAVQTKEFALDLVDAGFIIPTADLLNLSNETKSLIDNGDNSEARPAFLSSTSAANNKNFNTFTIGIATPEGLKAFNIGEVFVLERPQKFRFEFGTAESFDSFTMQPGMYRVELVPNSENNIPIATPVLVSETAASTTTTTTTPDTTATTPSPPPTPSPPTKSASRLGVGITATGSDGVSNWVVQNPTGRAGIWVLVS